MRQFTFRERAEQDGWEYQGQFEGKAGYVLSQNASKRNARKGSADVDNWQIYPIIAAALKRRRTNPLLPGEVDDRQPDYPHSR